MKDIGHFFIRVAGVELSLAAVAHSERCFSRSFCVASEVFGELDVLTRSKISFCEAVDGCGHFMILA